ncbi:uncharacterized protein AB675_4934 [Cyphellophora attinorum]|uniref:Uncharacterized protein n=1 Tax=Cyphellophora attinorum TaxID=1664694 RepID=A0A0N1H1G5_9EURO|nr:uncharacterized protein AB675_4934 [Phialophora attinorum]KPI34610.1 hypothetical protein AB675_4934 [Phialophora attinorum]
MPTLDTIPPEIRLNIFGYYMQDLTCKVALYIKPSCFKHHPDDEGNAALIEEDIRLSITFTPIRSHIKTHPPLSYNQKSFYSSLLASNRSIRQEFIAYVTKDLHLDLVGGGAPCNNCASLDTASDLVHEPWRSLVKTATLAFPTAWPSDGDFVRLRNSLSDGFPALRKVFLPGADLGYDYSGDRRTFRGYRTIGHQVFRSFPAEVTEALKTNLEAEALWRVTKWLKRYDATATSCGRVEWESLMTVGYSDYVFRIPGMPWPGYRAGGKYGKVLVKKNVDGRVSATLTVTDHLSDDRRQGVSFEHRYDGFVFGTFPNRDGPGSIRNVPLVSYTIEI